MPLFFVLLFFCIRFYKSDLPQNYFENVAKYIFIISTIIIILCTIIGIIIEIFTSRKRKNNILGDIKNEK